MTPNSVLLTPSGNHSERDFRHERPRRGNVPPPLRCARRPTFRFSPQRVNTSDNGKPETGVFWQFTSNECAVTDF